jgi:reactive intermediate/imine deaminase
VRRSLVLIVLVGFVAVVLGTAQVGTAAPAHEAPPDVEYLNADPATTAPYSDAVRVGSTLYLAGVLGLDQEGKIVSGGITPEAEKTMENLKSVVEANGSSLDRVAACEVMLADIAERDAFNEVYKKYWSQGKFPARHAFGVTGLYLGARVEIGCIAVEK